uniref:Uncharacterized protein n=1 Tax=viral metagenome TaxID=1070528 RepID=A0A6C0HGJ7_9ZZZZ
MVAATATASLPNLNLKIKIPVKDPEAVLRKANILSMLRFMCNDINDTQTTLNSIFNRLSKEPITCIKYHPIAMISGRPIVYVTSMVINDTEIPINMGFYKSTGISRSDSTIKECWFPTTQAIRITEDKYRLEKPEDNYILKYENCYNLSNHDILEQEELLHYGRFINKKYASVCYFLYKHNTLLADSLFVPIEPHRIIVYSVFLQGKESILLSDDK